MTWVEIAVMTIAGLALATEVIALLTRTPAISITLRRDGQRLLTAPAILGVLPGHFWSPFHAIPWGQTATLVLLGLVLVRDVLNAIFWRRAAEMIWPFVILLIFLFIGSTLWAQG